MRLQVKAQHDHLPEAVRAYAEKRLRKLDRRLHDLTLVEVTLSREHNPTISDALPRQADARTAPQRSASRRAGCADD